MKKIVLGDLSQPLNIQRVSKAVASLHYLFVLPLVRVSVLALFYDRFLSWKQFNEV